MRHGKSEVKRSRSSRRIVLSIRTPRRSSSHALRNRAAATARSALDVRPSDRLRWNPFDLLSIRKIVILSVPSEKFIPRTHRQQREREIVKALRQDCSKLCCSEFISFPPSMHRRLGPLSSVSFLFSFHPSVALFLNKTSFCMI